MLDPVESLFRGSLSSTMLVRVRIRSSILASVTGLTVELTSRRCSSCSGGSMRMKLVRSMPFGASLIWMPPKFVGRRECLVIDLDLDNVLVLGD